MREVGEEILYSSGVPLKKSGGGQRGIKKKRESDRKEGGGGGGRGREDVGLTGREVIVNCREGGGERSKVRDKVRSDRSLYERERVS